MKPARLLVGLSIIAAVTVAGTAANAAAPGLLDGSITVGGSTCTWTNATTSDVPPNTLTVDHTTVAVSCSGDTDVELSNDPTVSFDDAAGTASSPQIDVSGSMLGVTCGYRVSNVSIARDGTTRSYTGGPFTASKISGSFLCPSSQTVDSATFSFH
jgi:hypothetical protein